MPRSPGMPGRMKPAQSIPDLLAWIASGVLLSGGGSAGEVEDLLDYRDRGEFDSRWQLSFEGLEAERRRQPFDAAQTEVLSRIRELAFREAFSRCASADIAGYVSDDLELIALSRMLGVHDDFVAELWAVYERGELPPAL